MVKVFVFLSMLLVLGAAAPQNRAQKPGTPLQERRTKMEWEELGNAIQEVFGVVPDEESQSEESQDEEAQTEDQEPEQSDADRSTEMMRELTEREQDRSRAAGLQNREERAREAKGRAEGRLPEREILRRQKGQQKERELKQLSQRKQKQWDQDQERGEKKDRYFNNFPLYEFSYGVHDPETGDMKEQWEKRVGDHVKGKYTLDQPDGTKRVVEYEADDKNGFEAVVKEIDRIDERNRGDVRWGHSVGQVAQSYSKLKKVD